MYVCSLDVCMFTHNCHYVFFRRQQRSLGRERAGAAHGLRMAAGAQESTYTDSPNPRAFAGKNPLILTAPTPELLQAIMMRRPTLHSH